MVSTVLEWETNQEKLCQTKNMFKTFSHTERSVLANCVISATRDRYFVGI